MRHQDKMSRPYDGARRRASRGRRRAPWGLLIALGVAAGAAGAALIDRYAPQILEDVASAPPLNMVEDSQTEALAALWTAPPPPKRSVDVEPLMAIVLRDQGNDPALTMRALRLEAPITLALSAAAPDAASSALAARQRGREIVALLPVSAGAGRPQNGALSGRYGAGENARRAGAYLEALPGYAAISPLGSPAAYLDAGAMEAIAAVAADQSALFLDSAPYGRSMGARAAREAGVKTHDPDVFAPPNDRSGAWSAFDEAHELAQFWGDAVVVAELDTDTLRTLELWLADSPRALAPLSEILNRPPHEPTAQAVPRGAETAASTSLNGG